MTMTMTMAIASVGRAVCALIMGAATHISVRRRRRRLPPCCPVCLADAVAADERNSVDDLQVQIALRCGQCGTWRRLLTTHAELRRHDRERDEDRRAISAYVARLDVEQSLSDIDSFMHALRGELLGGGDFLARTQRLAETRRRPRTEPGP
jgi:hypothetical protein